MIAPPPVGRRARRRRGRGSGAPSASSADWRVSAGSACHCGVCVVVGVVRLGEQIELVCRGLARHGHLPDSCRESPMLRSNPADCDAERPASWSRLAKAAKRGKVDMRGSRQCASSRWLPDRTSRPEPPATGPMPRQKRCSGKPPRQPSRSPHEYGLGAPPKDAMDREARATSVPWAFCRRVVQRGPPTWRDREQGADFVCSIRWRRQPAIVKKAGELYFRRPKEWTGARRGACTATAGPNLLCTRLSPAAGRTSLEPAAVKVFQCQ